MPRPDEAQIAEISRAIEAVLFVSPEPAKEDAIAAAVGCSVPMVKRGIEALRSRLEGTSGLTVLRAAGGWQMATASELSKVVEAFQGTLESSRVRLSKAAFETLAVIAYNQPVTRTEMEEIRTVRCDRVVDTLMKHGLVRVAGRKKSVGNPLLYRTTDRFLELFALDSISSLPTLEELQETYVKTAADPEAEDEEWGEE